MLSTFALTDAFCILFVIKEDTNLAENREYQLCDMIKACNLEPILYLMVTIVCSAPGPRHINKVATNKKKTSNPLERGSG